MKLMERLIQKVDRTSWAKKLAIEKRYEPVEARLGFPRRGAIAPGLVRMIPIPA
ncbi:MAG: hypothetical protein HZY76_23015 [Anaerolineae bacterium]|nr:MAG: hypothetical protein HZY76_23015 [Anaerolineae bacterium]